MVRICTQLIQHMGTSSCDSLVACSYQKRQLDRTLQQKQRIAAQMKREQKEMQEFTLLMKSMAQDNNQHTTRLQDKIAQVHTISGLAKEPIKNVIALKSSATHEAPSYLQENKQTEQMRCELALLHESIAHVQQEQHSLQSHLAKQERNLTQKQTENSGIETHLVQLTHEKQQEEQHAQVQAK